MSQSGWPPPSAPGPDEPQWGPPSGPTPARPPVYGDAPRYGYQHQPPPPGSGPSAPSANPYAGPPPSWPPAGTVPQGPPYGAPGQAPSPYAPGWGAAPLPPLAPWGRRVGAYLIDFAPSIVASIPFWIGYVLFFVALAQSTMDGAPDQPAVVPAIVWMVVGGVLLLAALGWDIYNRWIVGGRTGQSMGKRMLKITLVAEQTRQPIGPLNAFLRDLVHIVDGVAYVGYLWPLWDEKRQTFADKIMNTIAVDVSDPSPDAAPRG